MKNEVFLRLAAVAGVAGLLVLGGWLRDTVSPQMQAPAALGEDNQQRLEHSASASLFGELRGGVADYLWMKADRILHNGVELRALTPDELRDPRRHHASVAPGESEQHHEEGETTVVPNREADRRGLMGDVERQIKPYRDMRNHHHRDERETAALFRLMTWANPHFIEGWVVGADILAGPLRRANAAIDFLREGEAQNPENIEIATELGRYLLTRLHDEQAAEKHFLRAIALGAARKHLSEDETDAWENAHRWLLIEYHRAGRRQEARAIAELGVRRFPRSGYFRRVLQRRELAAGQAL